MSCGTGLKTLAAFFKKWTAVWGFKGIQPLKFLSPAYMLAVTFTNWNPLGQIALLFPLYDVFRDLNLFSTMVFLS